MADAPAAAQPLDTAAFRAGVDAAWAAADDIEGMLVLADWREARSSAELLIATLDELLALGDAETFLAATALEDEVAEEEGSEGALVQPAAELDFSRRVARRLTSRADGLHPDACPGPASCAWWKEWTDSLNEGRPCRLPPKAPPA